MSEQEWARYLPDTQRLGCDDRKSCCMRLNDRLRDTFYRRRVYEYVGCAEVRRHVFYEAGQMDRALDSQRCDETLQRLSVRSVTENDDLEPPAKRCSE